MPKGRLEHANISVTDPERSMALLIDLLDWRERWRGASMGDGWTIHVGDEVSYIALYTSPQTQGDFAKKPAAEPHRLCGGRSGRSRRGCGQAWAGALQPR